jgi:hypothetical protein
MQNVIDYHQVLAGATDSEEGNPGKDFDEIIVGNRWSHDDLNSHVRKEEPYFTWTTHSALGGCCALHPFGIPIYPEGFTVQKLMRWKHRLGSYHFSCQFLNFPIDPSKKKFNMGDFRYFNYDRVEDAICIPKDRPEHYYKLHLIEHSQPQQYRTVIKHHVAEGDVERDVFPRNLDRYLITDPNHSGEHPDSAIKAGTRCRHAIIVIGISEQPRRIYLLDQWAEACDFQRYISKIISLLLKWKLKRAHCEDVASQKFLLFHFNTILAREAKLRPELYGMCMEPLKSSRSADAKLERIDNMIPAVERHEVWLDSANSAEFVEEAEKYGQQRTTIDLLDCFGYIPQLAPIATSSEEDIEEFMSKQRAAFARRLASVS